ncbi:DUF1566 domain-containing protein [Sorangium sp. So ce861]|uniref:Lcl C-terminal domain-containing protein n=1 Tax=Sorangium sp. So ce861 TaxID=3133323 RepID=UPI003F60D481
MAGSSSAGGWAMVLPWAAAVWAGGCAQIIDADWDEYTRGAGAFGGGELPPSLPVPVTWPDSMTQRCTDGTTFIDPCPDAGDRLFGQDGNYLINVPSYTASSDVTIDSVTGLRWTRLAEDTTEHDQYDARRYCNTFTDMKLWGRTDWRLPTIRELISIMDFGSTSAFPDVITPYQEVLYYHSASEVPEQTDESLAWGVWPGDFGLGTYDTAIAGGRVLCVSGSRLAHPEMAPADDWVLDRTTGLVWQRQAVPSLPWSEALSHCEELDLAGHRDWRLPSVKELLSLLDDRRVFPVIDQELFLDETDTELWSSTPAQYSAEGMLYFRTIIGDIHSSDTLVSKVVRCVRSGDTSPR